MDTGTSSLIPSISVAALQALHGTANAPLVIDVRRDAAWQADPQTLAGAMRCAPEYLAALTATLPRDRPIVAMCVYGHEVSQNAAKALTDAGLQASFLEGGMVEWKAAGGATMTRRETGAPSQWITRERPKIDRIACPWLIRRFIDPRALFHYVPSAQVIAEGTKRGATPYDVPGVRYSHRGEQCSFDAFIADHDLQDAALQLVARVVRGADCDALHLAPQSAGVLAISLGLSALHSDDHAMLEQGMVIYDALYAWAKSARGEAHNAQLFAAKAAA